jgi:prepilin-type N-terminal cleavage/methylation domain-containing protein
MKRKAFTVVELMIVIAIIALLAAMAASALSNAAEQARAQRTKAIIAKIDQLIGEKWESYRTRAIVYARHPNPRINARNRLYAMRELQRMELPDSVLDVWDNPTVLTTIPTATLGYRRKAKAPGDWSGEYENAECLYLIISSMRDGDKSALEYFTSSEIGDVDGDGMPEILDGWGEPIHFIRWPAGFVNKPGPDGAWGVAGVDDDGDGIVDNASENGWPGSDDIIVLTNRQTPDAAKQPDPFDPIRADPRVDPAIDSDPNNDTYALYPLIFSSGPDREAGIVCNGGTFRYATTNPPNDPYQTSTDSFGSFYNYAEAADNITNHWLTP